MKRMAALMLALALAGCATQPSMMHGNMGWAGVWGASPTIPVAGSKGYENQTIRQVVRVSQGGETFRIRFTNEYGEKSLDIGDAGYRVMGEAVDLALFK